MYNYSNFKYLPSITSISINSLKYSISLIDTEQFSTPLSVTSKSS